MSLTKSSQQIVVAISTIIILNLQATAQNAGINFNGSSPNPSAAFDIDVSALDGIKKGVLLPRVTQAERTAMNPLPAAAPGLIVYQTDGSVGFYYNTSGSNIPAWTQVMNTQSLRWDLLQSATGNLFLSNASNTTSITFNGVTEANAFSLSSNSLTKGNLENLLVNSTSGASGFSTTVLNLSHLGANAISNHTSVGISSLVSNTGLSSTNYAGYFKASGANFNFAIMVPDGGGKVSIGSTITSANALLTIKNGHFQSQQTVAPTISTSVNAGVLSDGTVEAGSSDMAGTFTINTTNTSLSAGAQATITFNETFGSKPRVVLTATNLSAANRSYYVGATASGFTIYFATAPAAATPYVFNYIIVEN